MNHTEWNSFFSAELGASAALTGLLFVSLSINLMRVLAVDHLPARAAEALVVLLSVLAVATFGLIPGQGHVAMGCETAMVGLIVWSTSLRVQLRAREDTTRGREWLWVRALGTQLASLPFVIAGALLVAGNDNGFYWIVPGVLASFASGVLNTWVLLVEIHR